MGERMELGFPRGDALSLREQAARAILRNVRSQGHTYVELRQDKRKCIFFCTLCLAPCYSDSVLFDHLKGNLHNERLAVAKLTLLGPNPWPFNDGVLFFDNSVENGKHLEINNNNNNKDDAKLLDFCDSSDNNSLAIVKYGDKNQFVGSSDTIIPSVDQNDDKGNNTSLLIPNVLMKTKMSELHVRFVGAGKISARFSGKDDKLDSIVRIWCEWLGQEIPDGCSGKIPQHDFAIIILGYNYDLGRKGFFDGDIKSLISSISAPDMENASDVDKKRKRCFSDPEVLNGGSLSDQYDSSGEDSTTSHDPPSRMVLDRYDDKLLHSRIISSKTVRRELRRQQRIAAERMCAICQQKMLPGKDVATLMNLKSGKLCCSSRNFNGAFHVYHTSCLIHWVLLCEFEIAKAKSVPKAKRRSKRKNGAKIKKTKLKKNADKIVPPVTQFGSVFCPECQGTGVDVEGDSLEKPVVPLSEMFKLKIRVSDARRAWMKSPEVLENCSVGFHFPSDGEDKVNEKMVPLKVLHFYGTVDSGCVNASSAK